MWALHSYFANQQSPFDNHQSIEVEAQPDLPADMNVGRNSPVLIAILAAKETIGFLVVADLFRLGIEPNDAANPGHYIAEMAQRR